MGFLFSKLANGPTEKKLLMLGLDNAGKTTLLYKLKLGEVVKTTPTIGFNLEQVSYKKLKFSVWDLGGQDRIRPLWRHYYQGMKGIIFVLDSNDRERCNEALDEIKLLTTEDQLKDCPILIFLNSLNSTGSMGLHPINITIKKARYFFIFKRYTFTIVYIKIL